MNNEFSFFNSQSQLSFLNRIQKLTPETKPLWGKMDVAQMLAHLSKPMEQLLGEIKPKRTFLGFVFGKMAKKSNLSSQAFRKNLPTDPHFVIIDKREFEFQKKYLLEQMKRASMLEPQALSNTTHSFFGPLTFEEWDLLQGKHFDHHLSQFGV